ncbi:MAG: hypothetical protein M1831_001997 [Alyxoria varia]|nr:MAG: hypothetical protein M1831_001997 [Alyxoria varia]
MTTRMFRTIVLLVVVFIAMMIIGSLYTVYKPPPALIHNMQERWPEVLFERPTEKKIVALTIDDAPTVNTHDIMEALKENDATATFFVIGNQVESKREVLEDAIRNGNELGNHAMRDEPSRSLDVEVLHDQVDEVQKMLYAIYESAEIKPPNRKYFRPGSGLFSYEMRRTLTRFGFQLVLGSIYPHDPQVHYSSINASHILSSLKPGGIIICHDRREWTAPMLREILPKMKERGYRTVTLTELLEETQPVFN